MPRSKVICQGAFDGICPNDNCTEYHLHTKGKGCRVGFCSEVGVTVKCIPKTRKEVEEAKEDK